MRKMYVLSFFKRLLTDKRGVMLPMLALMMTGFLGMGGLTVDVGKAYVVKAQLQSSANAAALSSAEDIYNSNSPDSASTIANAYSCNSGQKNAATVTMASCTATVTTPCINALLAGTTCAKINNVPNAVKVSETATMTTYFMRIFGINSLTVSATGTASFGTSQPYNVAVILDATPSMFSTDPNCPEAGESAEECALLGIQSMLTAVNPCRNGVVGCNATDANSIFRVAFFSFPDISVTDAQKDYQCGGNPTFQVYSYPAAPVVGSTTGYSDIVYKTKSGTSTDITYLLTQHSFDSANIDTYGFTSDYYSPSTANNLNPNSILIKEIGDGATKNCIGEPGGEAGGSGSNGGSGITYQAGAIIAAQNALNAEQVQTTNLGINATNVIIFVSDGQANAYSNYFPPSTDTITGGTGGYVTSGTNGTGKYPDYNDQCQQTIMAATLAQSQGTRVYGVAYGTETGGCSTDKTVVATGTSNLPVNITSTNQVVPCTVMEDMSSPEANNAGYYFYAEGTSASNGCIGNTTTGTNVNAIFQGIIASLTAPHLVSNNIT
ncbi:MAG: pilus assembly protein TadG-related protein [Terracidiphilus sp.]